MLQTQTKYKDFLDFLKSEAAKVEMNEIVDFDALAEQIAHTELVVPVIGAFSAGKSTLLNSFLGRNVLSVATTPETALATELRYSEDERFEGVKDDGSFDRFGIDEGEQIKAKASEYRYLRCFVREEKLRQIEPLILVDMPGFESPNASHNKAIIEYIGRGAYFIALNSVENGDITRSLIRELKTISANGRKFSFFVSKSNLKPDSEVEAVREKVKETLENEFDYEGEVVAIGKDGDESLRAVVSQIDPEAIFAALFAPSVKDKYFELKDVLNAGATALSNDASDSEHEIKKLRAALDDTNRQKDDAIANARTHYSGGEKEILTRVGEDLEADMSEIVVACSNGSGIENLVNDIVTHSLLSSLKTYSDKVASDVLEKFSNAISRIESGLTNNFKFETLGESIKQRLDEKYRSNVAQIARIKEDLKTQENATKNIVAEGKMMLLALGNVSGKVVSAIISILEPFLGSFFEDRKREKIEEKVRGELIPGIKSELRRLLPDLLQAQVEKIATQIAAEFEEKIKQQENALKQAVEQKVANETDIKDKIAAYKNAIKVIRERADKEIF